MYDKYSFRHHICNSDKSSIDFRTKTRSIYLQKVLVKNSPYTASWVTTYLNVGYSVFSRKCVNVSVPQGSICQIFEIKCSQSCILADDTTLFFVYDVHDMNLNLIML